MHTLVRKNITEKDMATLFMSDRIMVKYYKCIGEFSETEKNLYEINIRHADSTTEKEITKSIEKILHPDTQNQ